MEIPTILRVIVSLLLLVNLFPLPSHAAVVSCRMDIGRFLNCTAITGTTTDTYPPTAQVEWKDVGIFNTRTIYIANTHASNSLTYKVILKPSPADADTWTLPIAGVNENTLTANSGAIINIPESCSEVFVFFKSTTAGNAATFKVIPVAGPT